LYSPRLACRTNAISPSKLVAFVAFDARGTKQHILLRVLECDKLFEVCVESVGTQHITSNAIGEKISQALLGDAVIEEGASSLRHAI
jgi:hypothetical protein